MIGQVEEKGEMVRYDPKVSDCSVLKNISVITEREHWGSADFGVQLMSLHLNIRVWRYLVDSLKNGLVAWNW